MTRKLLLATTAIACLVLAACNKEQTSENTSSPDSVTSETPAGSAPGTANPDYSAATNAPASEPTDTTGLSGSASSDPSSMSATGAGGTDTATNMTPDSSAAAGSEGTSPSATPTVPESSLAAASTAQGFVQRAGMSDQFEIQASRLALARPVSTEIKDYAQMMIDAHTATTAKLKDLAANASLTLPTGLTAQEQAWLDDLRKASDSNFAVIFADSQVKAHQAALTLLKDYSASGDNAGLKQFAADTTPKVQEHLTRAENLSKAAKESNPS